MKLWRRRSRKKDTRSAAEIDSIEKTELEGSRGGHELSEASRDIEMDIEGARCEMAAADRMQEPEIGKPRQEPSCGEASNGSTSGRKNFLFAVSPEPSS